MKFKQLEKNDLLVVNGGRKTYWVFGIPITFAPWLENIIEDLTDHIESNN